MGKQKPATEIDHIQQRILFVRGERVLIDADLARLYAVTVKALNQAVKRNRARFPADFMFQLTWAEAQALRSQFVTLDSSPRGAPRRGSHRKYRPFAFTEQGVAMLSSVLRSPRAIRVNIEIMRAFVRLRRVLASNTELARRLYDLEAKVGRHDKQFIAVIQAIRALMEPPADPPRKRIGFATEAEG